MCVFFDRVQSGGEVGQGLLADAFKGSISRCHNVCFPIQCPEGAETHAAGHWALLVAEASEQGVSLDEPRVRYCEILNDVNEVSQDRALQI